MKIILYKNVLLCFLVLVITNCENKDNYDWKSVDPGKQAITGKDTIRGNNTTVYDYMAIPRGGSTFNWVSANGFLNISNDATYPYLTHIKANTTRDTTISLSLTETTYGGKTSQNTLNIFVQGYCPFDINQLIGSGKYLCTETPGYVPYEVTFKIISPDTITLDNFSNNGWPLKYKLSGDINEAITIVDNHFDYNGEPVIVKGAGTYNTCNGKISVNFAVVRPTGDTVLNSDNTVYAGIDKFTYK